MKRTNTISCKESLFFYRNEIYNLYMAGEFVDTKVVSLDGTLMAHSVILAAQSEVAYKILKDQKEIEKILELKFVSKNVLQYILEYIYRGVVTYPKYLEVGFNSAAKYLRLKDINVEEKKPFITSETTLQDTSIIEVSDNDDDIAKTTPHFTETEMYHTAIEDIGSGFELESDTKHNITKVTSPNENVNLGDISIDFLDLPEVSKDKSDNIDVINPKESDVKCKFLNILCDNTGDQLVGSIFQKDSSTVKNSDVDIEVKSEEKNPFTLSQFEEFYNLEIPHEAKQRKKTFNIDLDPQSAPKNDVSSVSRNDSILHKNTKKKINKITLKNKKPNLSKLNNNFCVECNKSYFNILYHIKLKHAPPEHKHQCRICFKYFYFESFLKIHLHDND